jgi:hypothetical protein
VKKFVLAVTVLALCALSPAETPGASDIKTQPETTARLNQKNAMAAATRSPQSTTACSFTFTSGFGFTFLKFCVTANGNIVQFETPLGDPMISQESFGEGYGICDATTHVSYFDFGGDGDSGNWAPATVLSNTAKAVKIARTTTDGIWTLTQTITKVAGTSPSATIAMALKNNSSVSREAFLMRFADVDAAGNVTNNFDATQNSAFGWNSITSENDNQPFGLVLQTVGTVPFGYDAFAQINPNPPDPCNPFTTIADGLITATDGSVVTFYDIAPVAKSSTTTVTVAYRGW